MGVVGTTDHGALKLEHVRFFVIARKPSTVLYSTARRKLKDTVVLFEGRMGRSWRDLMSEGYMVMKVYANLLDWSDNAMRDFDEWNREEVVERYFGDPS